MDSEGLQVIKNALDVVKIIGPALITGYVGYKAAKIQIDLRIKEIEKRNEFSARENLFRFYSEMRKEIAENSKELNKGVGNFIGQLAGLKAADIGGAADSLIKAYVKLGSDMTELQKAFMFQRTPSILAEMKKKGMEKEQIYELLKNDFEKLKSIQATSDPDLLIQNVKAVLEMNHHIYDAMDSICERERDSLFSKYLEVDSKPKMPWYKRLPRLRQPS